MLHVFTIQKYSQIFEERASNFALITLVSWRGHSKNHRVRWGLKHKHWDNFHVYMKQESFTLMSNRLETGLVLQRIKTSVAGGLEDQTWRGRSVSWRQYLPGEVLWLRPGQQCQHFPCWLLFVLKKNKQERRFRLAVTTFPVFVKRSPLISYKPPEYIRCKIYVHIFVSVCLLCDFSTIFPRSHIETHLAHPLH